MHSSGVTSCSHRYHQFMMATTPYPIEQSTHLSHLSVTHPDLPSVSVIHASSRSRDPGALIHLDLDNPSWCLNLSRSILLKFLWLSLIQFFLLG
ncbi:hypothetical protein RchiOBHm_Chr6g0273281 [Rosa chinensis]|uniref:Uncharacterized protein n=1 Tax=Rosa chinensis TaxID=74649 RepID=A0A2P6PRG5_ROSCH|nr:hypothetical protein RchiOBHm_Chr6g0273281 [Rosa chinensis]